MLRAPDPWHVTPLARSQLAQPPSLDPADPIDRWVALLIATFRQCLDYAVLAPYPEGKPRELRDQSMAENGLAQLDRFAPVTTAVIWAHNGQVYHETPAAGGHLRAKLGAAYRSVCCVFGRGSFNADSGRVNAETTYPEGQSD